MTTNGDGTATTREPHRPDALPPQPAGPMTSTADSPGSAGTTVTAPAAGDEKARRRAESQERAALMAQLTPEAKMAVARKELTLAEALGQAGLPIPEWLRTGASAPERAPVAPGQVEISATGGDPATHRQTAELPAQKGEAAAEGRDLVGGAPGDDVQPARPRTAADAAPPPAGGTVDPKDQRRADAQRKLALMQRLPSDLKLRVARREISLEDALREAGVSPDEG